MTGIDRWDSRHSHELGDCKWATAPVRQSKPRQGQHPREPRRPATGDPTMKLPGVSPAGEELGKEAEEIVDAEEQQRRLVEYENARVSSGNASSSTSVAPQAAGQQAGAELVKSSKNADMVHY